VLKGWDPKKLTGSPVMPGIHLRVRSADLLIFLQDNGMVHGLNRQGTGKPGFPIDLKGNISSALHIDKGSTLESSELKAVTNQGEFVEFNLLGKIIRSDQFLKESVDEVFRMVNSNDGEKYLVTRQTANQVFFYNENMEQLFDLMLSSSHFEIQYYSFDAQNEVVVVVDKENKLTYLYNMEGAMIHLEPLDTENFLAIVNHENGDYYEIYCTSGSKMKRVTINR